MQAGTPVPTPEIATAATLATPFRKVDYAHDIQPILSNYCYACHGPDTASRKAKLRLDLRDAALTHKGDDGNMVIVPGDPDGSDLVRRIESHDPDELMPQDADKRLSKQQITLLREWVRQGAEFRDHWAFEKPVRHELPAVKDAAWPQNDIDHFVLARLESEGLKPNAAATRRQLIRRVSLDLTGLLPTIAEVDAFVADSADDAYEKVVDRLLASPRYGEHRARFWMDYARYGDTQGLHVDNYQSRWPYRDYVIKAFNADMPYDQFTREQLAGDLMTPNRVDQLIATGLIRCSIASGEGGAIIEDLKVNLARERAEMYGAVYLGLTTGCAACHDHKYDPLTQRDFYQLTAFFNNLTEKASCDDRADWPPNIRVPAEANRAAYDAVLTKKADVLRQMAARRARAGELIAAWLSAGGPQPVANDGLELHLRLDEDYQEGSPESKILHNSAPNAAPATYTTEGPTPHWGEDTNLWRSLRLETNTRVSLGKLGDFEKDEAFSCGGWIKPRNVPGGAGWNTKQGALIAKMNKVKKHRGWNIFYTGGPLHIQLINSYPANMISIETVGTTEYRSPFWPPEGSHGGTNPNDTLPRGSWKHVFFTYDGSGKAAGVKVYINAIQQKVKVAHDSLTDSIRTDAPLWLGRRHDGDQMQASAYQDMRIYRRCLTPEEVARLPREDIAAEIVKAAPSAKWTDDQRKIVEDVFFTRFDDPSKAFAAQLPALDAELVKLAAKGPITLICREKPGIAYADILTRGAYGARKQRVRADVPHFLPGLPAGSVRDRLALAEWTVSADNPLTARVTVNRMWQEVFGIGISETSEDLGIVGARPSHAQLLDWLAVDFVDSGWQVKRLYKSIVMSAVYRQTTNASREALARDPKNQLLARGPRFRMEGEMLRDTALQASGLLVEKLGGASVKPYQPAGVWEAGSYGGSNTRVYRQDHGASLYRRSIYTFCKRMEPMPNVEAFDTKDRSATCVRRQRTNTPLAALVLMNDPQYLEAARHLGKRALAADGDAARIDFLGNILLSRPFDATEKGVLLTALQQFRDDLGSDSGRAISLLSVGESPRPGQAGKAEKINSLTTGKPATASAHLGSNVATIATDGVIDTNRYWEMDAAAGKPVWWQVDLEAPTEVARVVVVGYYGNARYYGFAVETSLDGQTWDMVADWRKNTQPATAAGYVCRFEPRPVRYIRVYQTHNSANSGRHLVEVMAYGKDPAGSPAATPLIEEAVWMLMATTAMNSDETINK